MCGFVGYVGKEIPTVNFHKMINSIHHRGPNSDGFWKDVANKVHFAHKRLSIMDITQNGSQPMTSTSGRYTIIYNGEIYNHLILRDKLDASQNLKKKWKGYSDTETILEYLDIYGFETTLKKIEGMFSMVIYDKKNNNILLTRDRIGEKPLYYAKYSNYFIFGSELKALKHHTHFKKIINHSSIDSLMRYNFIKAPYSIYQDVYKVNPGTYISFSINSYDLQIKSYWSAKDYINVNQSAITKKDYITDFDNLLNNTVKNQMLSDVPLGVFLSGGIDSSLITSLMVANSNKPIKSFTVGFKDDQFNEAKEAKSISNFLKTDHTEIILESTEALNVVEKLPEIYSEPFADSSQIPTFLISKITKESVSVALSGDGGDELFGGYNKYKLISSDFFNFIFLPKKIKLLLSKLILKISVSKYNIFYNKYLTHIKFFNIDNIGDKLHKYANILLLDNKSEIYFSLIDNFYKKKTPVKKNNFKEFKLIDLYLLPDFKLESEKMMYCDLIAYLPDDILCKVDRASMSVSLETRAPFLSHKVVEYALKLPIEKKIYKNKNKIILRETLSKYIPSHLMSNSKKGFAIPLASWLRGPLKDWSMDLLNDKDLRQYNFFDYKIYENLFQDHLDHKKNNEKVLWSFFTFLNWLKKHK